LKIPEPRGPISDGLFGLLAGQPAAESPAQDTLHRVVTENLSLIGDIIEDDDAQLALFCLYELHYGGLDGVDDRWEWNPGLIALRQLLEGPFEQALRSAARLSAGALRLTRTCRGTLTRPLEFRNGRRMAGTARNWTPPTSTAGNPCAGRTRS
jgi:hypothetical protein